MNYYDARQIQDAQGNPSGLFHYTSAMMTVSMQLVTVLRTALDMQHLKKRKNIIASIC